MYERSQHNSASKTLGRSLHTGLLASVLLLLLVTGQHAAVWGPSVGTSLTAWLLLAAAAALATMQRVHAATDTAAQPAEQASPEAASPPDRYAVLCFPMPDPAWTLASAVPAPSPYAMSLRDLRTARSVAAATRRASPLVARPLPLAFALPMTGKGGARGPAPAAASPSDEPAAKGKLRIDARMFARMSSQQILQGVHV